MKIHLSSLFCVNDSLGQLLNEFRVQRVNGGLVHADGGNAVSIGLHRDLGVSSAGGAEL